METAVRRDERILIIDDQALAQSYLRYALEQLGYNNISYADKAAQALNACRQSSFDLIICSYNLPNGKDGYQLYEELKVGRLQPLTCGFIFVSSDTDLKLVHSVLELQPDEFLAKPFVIRDLQNRIERLLQRKQQLRLVYELLDQQLWAKALEQINLQLTQAEQHKLFPLLLKLKADVLLKQRDYGQGLQFFRAMLQIQPFGWARTGLVKCLLQLGDEQQAFTLLEQLLQRSETRLFALDCLADLEFKQKRYQQAQQLVLAAADMAPRNLLRQQKLLQLSRLNHDYEVQYRAARDMVKFARHSVYEQPDLYLNLARASIDYALSSEDSDQYSRLNRQATMSLSTLQRQFANYPLTEQQQVLQARLLYLQDHGDKARQMLSTLDQQKKITSLEDALDKAKALHEVGLTDASKRLFQQISEHCQQQADPVFSAYLQQEKQERELMTQGPRELNNSAVQLYQRGHWQQAYNAFLLARKVMPKNAGIALNLWQTLLTSPKPLCPQQTQQELLLQCQQMIESSKLTTEQAQRYQHLQQKYLARQA